MHAFRYGPHADHEADLHLPAASNPPVVVLLHGGFWRMPYGRDQMTAVAEALATRGFAVWNLSYRRVGARDAAWPATLDDVARGIDHIAQLARDGVDLDLERVTVVGHSAGGHLALWAAARDRPAIVAPPRVRIALGVGLAPVADLAEAHRLDLGGGAVAAFLGGAPSEVPERHRTSSPRAMLPLGTRQLLVHGTDDDAVPIELSRDYARAAAAAGDDVELIELAGAGHMEFLDPGSRAFATLGRWLLDRSA